MLRVGGGRGPGVGVLRGMVGMLRHRGPDGVGMYVDDWCGLGHARLSIIDLGGGAQPMGNEDETVWVTFNGEVFNYVELRRELEGSGHRFRTESDTEAIVHGFEEWGDGVWARLEGQFAVGLWDSRTRTLRLVRDRAGIAPLFFARGRARDGGVGVGDAGERVWFGSEVKAVLAGARGDGVEAQDGIGRMDAAGLAAVFTMWSCPGPRTVFAGVRSVCPGEVVEIAATDGRERSAFFARASFAVDESLERVEDAAERLDAALRESIRIRLRADVPVGCYVSGGLDSSVIARLAREIHGGSMHTFSLRFEDPAFDETSAQRRVAELLGTEHHEILVGPEQLQGAIRDVVWHAETPLLRTGPAPMFLLSGLVRQCGMKVVLTGEGADELLGGYDVFKEAKVRRFWGRDAASAWRPALLGRVHPYVAIAGAQGGMWREFFRRGLDSSEGACWSHGPRWETTAWAMRFLSAQVREAAARLDPAAMVERLMGPQAAGTTALGGAQRVEWSTFMGSYLLSSQGDRMALGHGVEARYPFLDSRVIDLAGGLRDRHKMCGLREKVTLRKVAERVLPEEIRGRRKWPYRAPIGRALFGAASPDWVREAMSPELLARCAWVDAKTAGALAGRYVGGGSSGSSAATNGAEGTARIGEREEMALVGLLTLVTLERQFGREFGESMQRAAQAMERVRPDVMVDRRKEAGHG